MAFEPVGPWTDAGHPRLSEVTAVVKPDEIKKGQRIRYTDEDQSWDYVVTDVSEPDEMGSVTLSVEPV